MTDEEFEQAVQRFYREAIIDLEQTLAEMRSDPELQEYSDEYRLGYEAGVRNAMQAHIHGEIKQLRANRRKKRT